MHKSTSEAPPWLEWVEVNAWTLDCILSCSYNELRASADCRACVPFQGGIHMRSHRKRRNVFPAFTLHWRRLEKKTFQHIKFLLEEKGKSFFSMKHSNEEIWLWNRSSGFRFIPQLLISIYFLLLSSGKEISTWESFYRPGIHNKTQRHSVMVRPDSQRVS